MMAPEQIDENFIYQVLGPSPTPLQKAIADGDVRAVLRAMVNGDDPLQPSSFSELNALHLACLLGRAEVAMALLALNSTLLHSVHGPTQGRPLHFACQQPQTDVVRVLLESGADVLRRDGGGRTCLHLATAAGNTEAVKLLVDTGKGSEFLDALEANNGITALMLAVSLLHTEIMRILLEGGASPRACRPHGLAVLDRASKEGMTDIVKLLIQKGADPCERTTIGTLPIHEAALAGHTGTLEVLLNASPNTLNAKTNTGATPLIMCAQKGHVETVKLLIARGADVNLRDAFAQYPWQIAMQSKDPRGVECAKLIEEAGGKGDGQLRGPIMLQANDKVAITRHASGGVSIEDASMGSDNPFTVLK